LRSIYTLALLAAFNCAILTAGAQEGFTNKAEALNGYNKEGLKQGKWIAYYADKDNNTDTTSANVANYYTLAFYKNGKPYGRMKKFDMGGNLINEYRYNDGKLDEIRKYHDNGRLYTEVPYTDGKKNGLAKEYYESGILMSETVYYNGRRNGIERYYHHSGKIKSETWYNNGRQGETKYYEDRGE
jgi:antitoxin component YwqK of YwqJK toxin-antitoxin module